MSRKTLTIIVSIILVIFVISLIGYYFIINRNPDGTTGGLDFRSFLPFGGSDNTGEEPSQNNQNTAPGNGETPVDTDVGQVDQNEFLKKLRKISDVPVSGYGSTDIKAGTVARYIEKATGHIYEVEMFSPRKERISNTTIPLSYDAKWGNKNNSLVARYLSSDDQYISTYLLNIANSTTTERAISSIQLPENILDVAVNGAKAFYLVFDQGGSSGFVTSFDNKSVQKIWTSDMKEFNSQFVNDRIVALTTKPHPKIPGFLYLVNTSNGSSVRPLGKIEGLSTLVNPSATEVAYLDTADSSLNIYTVKDGSKIRAYPLTFPEKCVWSKLYADLLYCAVPKEQLGQNSLINWYQGKESYSDSLFIYNSKTGISFLIENLRETSGEDIDLISPTMSDNGQYLFFMNKIDNTLWGLNLTTIATTTSTTDY